MYELQSVSLLSLSQVVHHKVKGVTIFELKLCGVKLPLFTLDGPNISKAEAISQFVPCLSLWTGLDK